MMMMMMMMMMIDDFSKEQMGQNPSLDSTDHGSVCQPIGNQSWGGFQGPFGQTQSQCHSH